MSKKFFLGLMLALGLSSGVLAAGGWVYGSFSTWIGSEDKNRGWDYLVAAKQAYDSVVTTGNLSLASASTTGGWLYDTTAGKFLADHSAYDDR